MLTKNKRSILIAGVLALTTAVSGCADTVNSKEDEDDSVTGARHTPVPVHSVLGGSSSSSSSSVESSTPKAPATAKVAPPSSHSSGIGGTARSSVS